MKYILLLLFITTSVLASAQDSVLARKYDEKTIFVFGGKYLLDNQRVPKSSLKVLLSKYADSRTEYATSAKWKTGATIVNTAALAFYMASLSQLNNHNYQKFNGYMIASFATSMVSIPLGKQAKKRFDKAVWLYNKNALIH